MATDLERLVMSEWNSEADEYNQWHELDADYRNELICNHVSKRLSVFKPMLEARKSGRHVTKLCYGLTNEHLDAVQDLLGS